MDHWPIAVSATTMIRRETRSTANHKIAYPPRNPNKHRVREDADIRTLKNKKCVDAFMYPLIITQEFSNLHKSDVVTLDKFHCTILPSERWAFNEEKWRTWLTELDSCYADFFITEDYIQANTPTKKIKDMTSIYSTHYFLKQNNFILDSEDYAPGCDEYAFVYIKPTAQKIVLSSDVLQALSFSNTVTVTFATSPPVDLLSQIKRRDAELYCVVRSKLSAYPNKQQQTPNINNGPKLVTSL